MLLGVFYGVGKPNDTIVAEAEAKHPDAVDHVLLMVSHGSMLLSNRAASCVAHFLADGRFEARDIDVQSLAGKRRDRPRSCCS